MKRLPVFASFVLFIALCASGAFWAMQLFKPPARPVAAVPQEAKPVYKLDAATTLFGGGKKLAVVVASNYALKGVVVARNARESVAILATDGKPGQAIGVGEEVVRGVSVKEVHPQYVLLSEGGVIKRVQLPESSIGQAGGISNKSGLPGQVPPFVPSSAIPMGGHAMSLPGMANPGVRVPGDPNQ